MPSGPLVLPLGVGPLRIRGPLAPNRASLYDMAGGVFLHAIAVGFDPDGVVHDAAHDRAHVNPGAEVLVPVFLVVLNG